MTLKLTDLHCCPSEIEGRITSAIAPVHFFGFFFFHSLENSWRELIQSLPGDFKLQNIT